MAGRNRAIYRGVLLDLIRKGQNEEFKTINEDLIKNSNGWKTLLHHAAFYRNEEITRHLMDMGADIDAVDSESKTPLMIAVEVRSLAVVNVLLDANANIDVAGADGPSALQMVLDSKYGNIEILESFLRRLRRDSSTLEDVAERLIDVGCTMFHACLLRDLRVMELLLERGANVNSRGCFGKTALHAAVEMDDIALATWILDHGGEVDALHEYNMSPLFDAASRGKVDVLRLLLERGADPNTKQTYGGYTPLFSLFAYSVNQPAEVQKNFDDCIELLLQHGAIPENSSLEHSTLFDYALLNERPDDKIDYLIYQLAILDRLGKVNAKSVMICNVDEHKEEITDFEEYYEWCEDVLKWGIHGKLTLFDLLTCSECTLRIHVRNEGLVRQIDRFYLKLSKFHPFYYRMLKKRVTRAVDRVKLEAAAIRVIPKLFNGNHNLCYEIARQLVCYLSEKDLEQLSNALTELQC